MNVDCQHRQHAAFKCGFGRFDRTLIKKPKKVFLYAYNDVINDGEPKTKSLDLSIIFVADHSNFRNGKENY
ncbi:hypothetical protein BLOT_016388 [Blomia tropicalis]|nr:hypothetical protein BLOT_016388 [Blomia tropicalis]